MRGVFFTTWILLITTTFHGVVYAEDPFEVGAVKTQAASAFNLRLGGEIIVTEDRQICSADAPFCISIRNALVDDRIIAEQGYQGLLDRANSSAPREPLSALVLNLGALILRLQKNEKAYFEDLYSLYVGGKAIFTVGRFENEIRLTVFAPHGEDFSFTGLLDGQYIRGAEAAERVRVHVIQLSNFEMGPELGFMLNSLPDNTRIFGTFGLHAGFSI